VFFEVSAWVGFLIKWILLSIVISNLVSLAYEWMLSSLKYPITCLEDGQIPWKDSQLSVKTTGIRDEMWLWDLNIKQEHYPTGLNYITIFLFMFLTYLIFIGPCIVIYTYSTTNTMHLLSQIIYSCKTLYMFRTVFPSIIRSSKLRIQQRYTSNWNYRDR
jgi:hypothetical protein